MGLRKKKAPPPGQRIKVDMQFYFRKTNWADMWEEFYTALAPSGLHKYKTIRAFAGAKAKSPEQLRFLIYYLGPANTGDVIEQGRYHFVKPQDWKKRRDTNGWYTDENIEALSKVIAIKANALEALAEAGNHISLRAFLRISNLMKQLDNAFQGRFFVEENDFATNVARSEAYLRLYNRVLSMLGSAQDLFAKSRGINFNDMEGLAHIVAATAQMSKQVGDTTNKYEKALGAIVQMSLRKAGDYDLPLPQEIKDKIIEAVQDEPEKPHQKKKVN